jgi:hypothetical protein
MRKLERKDIKVLVEQTLNETSFNRVKDHIEKNGVPFVMISAARGGRSRKENNRNLSRMKQVYDTAGFSYIRMPGSGGTEDGVTTIEDSILVYDLPRPDQERSGVSLFELSKKLAKVFEQEWLVYGDGQSARGYDSDGNVIDWAGPWSTLTVAAEDAEFWSMINGHKGKLVT